MWAIKDGLIALRCRPDATLAYTSSQLHRVIRLGIALQSPIQALLVADVRGDGVNGG